MICYHTKDKYIELVTFDVGSGELIKLKYYKHGKRNPGLSSIKYQQFLIDCSSFRRKNIEVDTRNCKDCKYKFKCATDNFKFIDTHDE